MMNNKDLSITEISNLTGKSRPTIYKYLNAFSAGSYGGVPYNMIKLFKMLSNPTFSKPDITAYCQREFLLPDNDIALGEVLNLIKTHKDRLDMNRIKQIIEEELEK